MGYENGLIYKLCCNDTNIKEEYVGSTINFNERKRTHKKGCNNPNSKEYNYRVYKFIRENGGFDENWCMILVEKFPCNDRRELETRERHWIELLESKLNCVIPTRTEKEYRDDNKERTKLYLIENKEHIKEQKKQWRLNNLDKIKEQKKIYRADNADKIKEYSKKYYGEHIEEQSIKNKEYYQENKEHIKEQKKERYKKNADKLIEERKEKVVCECGCEMSRCSLPAHRKTQKHIKLMIAKNNPEV